MALPLRRAQFWQVEKPSTRTASLAHTVRYMLYGDVVWYCIDREKPFTMFYGGWGKEWYGILRWETFQQNCFTCIHCKVWYMVGWGLVKGSIVWCDWDCSSYRIPSIWSQFLVNCPCMTWFHKVALASKFYAVLEVILHYPYPCMTCVRRLALASDSTLLEVWTIARIIRPWPWSPALGRT